MLPTPVPEISQTKNFYHFSCCHSCKTFSTTLKRCSGCKSIYYCTREHQQSDWPNHRKLCQIIAKSLKILTYKQGCSAKEFAQYKTSLGILWSCELTRSLKPFEHQMWMFPKVCAICYSSEANIVCDQCLSVAYCSEQHKEQHLCHKDTCEHFKLLTEIMETAPNNKPSLDWNTLKIDANVNKLPNTLEEVLKLLSITREAEATKKYIDYVSQGSSLCPALNILYALEKSGVIVDRQVKNCKIVIHLVGANSMEEEMLWETIAEFICHWIMNLTVLKIVLIGPELNSNREIDHQLCTKCKSEGLNLYIPRITRFYHDVVMDMDKPDLVVVFNSGLHEFQNSKNDIWQQSIESLLYHESVPLLLTAYTKNELQKDLKRFDKFATKVIVNPDKNPFSDMKPLRNWEEGADSEPIYYQNGYLTVITKQ